MTNDRASPAASAEDVTALILRIFRLNGQLLQAGDTLVAPLGLTSARWQVLGSIAAMAAPQPVAALAREMGLARQSVQRIVDALEGEGLVAFLPNPRHKRAQLVAFTEAGRSLYERALALQRPWAAALGRGVTAAQLSGAAAVLDALLADRLLDRDR